MQENASEDATSRRNPASKQLIFKAYQCDPEACDESNGCYSNRTGIACGRCLEHWVLEGSVCQDCSNYYSTDTKKLLVWRIVFGVGGGLLFLILIFVLNYFTCENISCYSEKLKHIRYLRTQTANFFYALQSQTSLSFGVVFIIPITAPQRNPRAFRKCCNALSK